MLLLKEKLKIISKKKDYVFNKIIDESLEYIDGGPQVHSLELRPNNI